MLRALSGGCKAALGDSGVAALGDTPALLEAASPPAPGGRCDSGGGGKRPRSEAEAGGGGGPDAEVGRASSVGAACGRRGGGGRAVGRGGGGSGAPPTVAFDGEASLDCTKESSAPEDLPAPPSSIVSKAAAEARFAVVFGVAPFHGRPALLGGAVPNGLPHSEVWLELADDWSGAAGSLGPLNVPLGGGTAAAASCGVDGAA